ncbi:polysaccharide deacetylase family protein [Sphingoaurantiacus capsulatus]|uniref:Chitooligosaccharide deacetylase n=1 Tax=Sphingoaurantiacus capsulatus TaxID=1771310 RepID=A0ABV7XDS4_9SPHN
MKQALLSTARGVGLFALARKASASKLRILCYHGLWTTPGFQYGNRLFMPPEQFDARMTRLRRSGYPVLGLDMAVAALAAGTLPDNAVVITIDDGWASTHTHMLPTLEALGLPSTVYVASWYVGRDLPVINKAIDYLHARTGRDPAGVPDRIAAIDALPPEARADAMRALSVEFGVPLDWWETRQFHEMTPAEVGDCARRGMDVQLHTHRHRAAADLLAGELEENRVRLAEWTGLPPGHFRHFCYPSGEYEAAAEPVLAASGVLSATLTDQGTNAPGANPFRLRRFLDGRTVTDAEFDAYLSGALDVVDAAAARMRRR